jgi:hypothetical protein
VGVKDALKHQVPTVRLWGVGRVNVESSPLVVEVPVEPALVPPVHDVAGEATLHKVQLTAPVGGPPAELPATVAVSPQGFVAEVPVGAMIVVVNPGVAGVTVRHSAGSLVPKTLSLEPW